MYANVVFQTWFKCPVHNIENINVTRDDECNTLTKSRVGIMLKEKKT